MIVSGARAFQSTLKMQISDHPSSISINIYFSMRRMYWPILSWKSKMQAQKAVLTCFCRYSSHIKQNIAFDYTTSEVHRQLSTYSMSLWPSFDKYNHHCKSKTAKSFVDGCLIVTTPKYYVWPSFGLVWSVAAWILAWILAWSGSLFVCHAMLSFQFRG